MRIGKTAAVIVLAACVVGVAGCDVEKKKDGDITLPQYEVSKTKDGNVTVPTYEVTTPDVTVEKKEVEVTVPKVTTEKETVTVPHVEIKPASEK
ncbi:MAG: hypothetical protein ABIP38_07260 [Steroidobacteraceae bacterium]